MRETHTDRQTHTLHAHHWLRQSVQLFCLHKSGGVCVAVTETCHAVDKATIVQQRLVKKYEIARRQKKKAQ